MGTPSGYVPDGLAIFSIDLLAASSSGSAKRVPPSWGTPCRRVTSSASGFLSLPGRKATHSGNDAGVFFAVGLNYLPAAPKNSAIFL